MPRYIDADALVAELQKKPIHDGHFIHTRDVSDAIFYAPTISPDEARGVGKWLPDVGEFGFPEIPCSVCGYKSGHYGFNYCPSCGARMTRAEAEKAMEVRE